MGVEGALLVVRECVWGWRGVSSGGCKSVCVCVWRGDCACVECNYIHVCTARIGVL